MTLGFLSQLGSLDQLRTQVPGDMYTNVHGGIVHNGSKEQTTQTITLE